MAISVVQRNKGGNAAASNTLGVAFTGNTAAGNALIAICTSDGADTTMSAISDTQGKTWNLVKTLTKSSFSMKVWIAYSSNAAADTITVTTGFNDSNLFIFEVAGLAASNAYDTFKDQVQSSSTALDSTNTPTLTNANNLVIGITANTDNPGKAPTAGAGYGNLQTLTTAFNGGGSEEKIVTATTAVNATFGQAANANSARTAVFVFSDTAIVVAPTVTTQAVTSISGISAIGNGNVIDTGGATVDERGMVYGEVSQALPGNVAPGSSGYTTAITESGSFSTGAFTETLINLQGNRTYYVRAYSHNSSGYSYGAEVSFTTPKTISFIINKIRPAPFKPGLAR